MIFLVFIVHTRGLGGGVLLHGDKIMLKYLFVDILLITFQAEDQLRQVAMGSL